MIYCEDDNYLEKILLNISGWEYQVEKILANFSLNNIEQDIKIDFVSSEKIHKSMFTSYIKSKSGNGDIYEIAYDASGKARMGILDDILYKLCLAINRTIKECKSKGEVLGDIYCAICPSVAETSI